MLEEHDSYGAKSFVCGFVQRYGPSNVSTCKYPIKDSGMFKGVPFDTEETRNSFRITMCGISRRFKSAWQAGRWVEKNAFRLNQNGV